MGNSNSVRTNAEALSPADSNKAATASASAVAAPSAAEVAAAAAAAVAAAPPKPIVHETVEEKIYRKFTQQPLIPIGCIATAYFLASGIKSFAKRDPIRSQRMMRNRVLAQFATLAAFIGYMGIERADFRLAPIYQDVKKLKQWEKDNAAQEQAAAAALTRNEE